MILLKGRVFLVSGCCSLSQAMVFCRYMPPNRITSAKTVNHISGSSFVLDGRIVPPSRPLCIQDLALNSDPPKRAVLGFPACFGPFSRDFRLFSGQNGWIRFPADSQILRSSQNGTGTVRPPSRQRYKAVQVRSSVSDLIIRSRSLGGRPEHPPHSRDPNGLTPSKRRIRPVSARFPSPGPPELSVAGLIEDDP